MQEVPLLIVVFGALVLVVDQLRRLFTAISVNRSIREALKHHPDSVPMLLERLESRSRMPLALGGWVFLGLGILIGLMLALAPGDQDRDALLASIVISALGVALLVASWWTTRLKS